MKKILLFFAIILAINPNNQAQNCFPDSSYITPGYYPDSLYPAHLNANYEQTVTIIVPKDTLIELIPGFPITIDIDSIVVTSITNLPVGFSYICEPVSCGFLGNERGCLKIIGNPVDPSLVGEYNLIGQVKAYAAQAGALSPLDETVNLGKFSILSPVSISKNSEAAIASLQVYPNPIQQNSTLLFTAAQKSIYNVSRELKWNKISPKFFETTKRYIFNIAIGRWFSANYKGFSNK